MKLILHDDKGLFCRPFAKEEKMSVEECRPQRTEVPTNPLLSEMGLNSR
jgi:hypothetical protein